MDSVTEPRRATDRELVLGFRPAARVESRTNPRTTRFECRIVCVPVPGGRADLGAWCNSEERAWRAACLKLGLRLGRRT